MSRPKVPIRGRGGVHAHTRAAQAAHREKLIRKAAAEDTLGLVANLRENLDEAFSTNKRDMAERGLDRTHALLVIPNPHVDMGAKNLAINFQCLHREDLAALHQDPGHAEICAALADPPQEGFVWCMYVLPNKRVLMEESIEGTTTAAEINARGGKA